MTRTAIFTTRPPPPAPPPTATSARAARSKVGGQVEQRTSPRRALRGWLLELAQVRHPRERHHLPQHRLGGSRRTLRVRAYNSLRNSVYSTRHGETNCNRSRAAPLLSPAAHNTRTFGCTPPQLSFFAWRFSRGRARTSGIQIGRTAPARIMQDTRCLNATPRRPTSSKAVAVSR